jgi:hypothetical protein
MTIVTFPRVEHARRGTWRSSELDRLLPPCAIEISQAAGNNGFAVGSTEAGDPQLYVFGAPPDYDCVLCITRIGNLYIMEDGAGRIVLEHTNLMTVAEKIPTAISRRKAAKLALLWTAMRQTIEEKVEPVLVESMEFATHFSPQLAAFA